MHDLYLVYRLPASKGRRISMLKVFKRPCWKIETVSFSEVITIVRVFKRPCWKIETVSFSGVITIVRVFKRPCCDEVMPFHPQRAAAHWGAEAMHPLRAGAVQ
jgi:hypothetical protein